MRRWAVACAFGKRGALLPFLALATLALPAGGCYLTRTLVGGIEILTARRPIQKVIADPRTDPRRAARLRQILEMRDFASRELGLPDNGSYRTWVDLDRPYAVWNVVATPELSIDPVTWCFPVVGCVSYRGYFTEERAERFAAGLRRRGLDVAVGGVAAYSTLGRFRDPVLSTFLELPQPELAGLLFHELAHQRLYVSGDVAFNESFATAVELAGVRRWLAARGEPGQIEAWSRRRRREEDFNTLLRRTRRRLEDVYAATKPDVWKRRRKAEIFAALEGDYRQLRDGPWDGYSGYNAWFARDLNNAHLAALEAYDRWLPALEAILARLGGELERFYAEMDRLAQLTPEAREAKLKAILDECGCS